MWHYFKRPQISERTDESGRAWWVLDVPVIITDTKGREQKATFSCDSKLFTVNGKITKAIRWRDAE